MGYWTVVVPAERYAQERLVGNVSLAAVPGPAPGDQVALVAGVEPPVVFGLGTVGRDGRVHYTRRLFDAPLPADDLATGPLPPDVFAAPAAQAGPDGPVRPWVGGADLPKADDQPGQPVP